MPIPLGVLAVAGAGGGGGAAGAYEWIETVSVGTAVSSVSFSNLNSTYGTTYQHLQLRAAYRTSSVVGFTDMRLRFNSDTGSNYSFHVAWDGLREITITRMYLLPALLTYLTHLKQQKIKQLER